MCNSCLAKSKVKCNHLLDRYNLFVCYLHWSIIKNSLFQNKQKLFQLITVIFLVKFNSFYRNSLFFPSNYSTLSVTQFPTLSTNILPQLLMGSALQGSCPHSSCSNGNWDDLAVLLAEVVTRAWRKVRKN